MKKILGLTIAAIMVLAMIGGGTYALFSDTETSLGNTWAVGTLNLVNVISGTAVGSSIVVTEAADGINDKVEFGTTDPILPGDKGTITWTLTDTGNAPGTLTMVALSTFGEGAAANEAELTADSTNLLGLGQNLKVWLTRDGTDILGATGVANYVAMSGLDAILNAESRTMVGTPPGTAVIYILNWEIPLATDSRIQGDTATLDITFTLTQ